MIKKSGGFMDELISRQEAIEAVETKIKKWNAVDGEGYHVGLGLRYTDVIDTLTELPSAQTDIIRCKECKYAEHWYRDKAMCFLWHETGIDVFNDGFCNYAGRRTDEAD